MDQQKQAGGAPTKRRRTVVSLEAFANRSGVGKAIAKFRERKQRKRRETAQALRQYAKVMKEEGYEAGRGASRKRKESSTTEEQSTTVDNDAMVPTHPHTKLETANNDGNKPPRKRHNKTNPYKDLEQQHEKSRAKVVDSETQEKERRQKLRQRRQRTHKLRQKTSRGQPVMRQRVALILEKLENETCEGA